MLESEKYQKYQQFYFHSVRLNLETLYEILRNGYILSKEKAELKKDNLTFNGEKWISICKYYDPYYDPNNYEYTYFPFCAYQFLVVNGISIVLDNRIEATKTVFMPYDELYPGVIKEENLIRYSDCIDEYQVRDSISKEHFLAVMYPYLGISLKDKEKARCEYDKIRYWLNNFQYDLPIIDSSREVIDNNLANLEMNIKLLKKTL